MLLILEKVKEVLVSIIPIFLVIIVLSLSITPLSLFLLGEFIIGTLLIIIGMPVFLLGIDISITPIGEQISETLTNSNKLWIILLGGAFFGFMATIAEPDLYILAGQVKSVTNGRFDSGLMLILVSAGIGFMVTFGMFRILKNIVLKNFMTAVYLIVLLLAVFSENDFIAIAFDASGSTTGSISVPFILALSVGVSAMTRSNEKEENDGFGMLGITSAGAIIAVLFQGLLSNTALEGDIPGETLVSGNLLQIFGTGLLSYAKEALLALIPILSIYFIANAIWIKVSKNKFRRILIGAVYTYIGLIFFLTGVNIGFIQVCTEVGYHLASLEVPWLLVIVGMLFGVITIPAEPSVHILTRQIEDETAGSIKAKTVMFALCLGVSTAVGLSILRILIPKLQLWHILLPGMLIAIVLSYIVPDIFVGIAYDSGGVAAGTMTAAFILPYTQGAANYIPTASIVKDGFGVIALVAMTPLITVQILGLIYKLKSSAQLE